MKNPDAGGKYPSLFFFSLCLSPLDQTLVGVPLAVRAITNSTYGHHGEMAHGEIYYVDTPARAGTAEWW